MSRLKLQKSCHLFTSSFSRFFLSILIFCIFIISNAVSSSSVKNCAVFKSPENRLQSQTLPIFDGHVVGNIPDEYATATESWNASGYWTISTGCELTACENEYLTANCSKFGSNASPTNTTNRWQSARCSCNKNCTCSNIALHRTVCARAYFQPNGCNVCEASYTELEDSNPRFSDGWTNKISSFLLRPGCTIKVYEEEGYEGESKTIDEMFVENWNGTIRSYECQCNDAEYLVAPKKDTVQPTDDEYPQIEIPYNLDAIVSLLRQHSYNHSGLLAAFSSLTHGRSSKNAYILLIGSTGGGKSSAINNLLNNPNVTLVGDVQSTTSQILEFRIPTPIHGVSNSELRIIDTPGLGDTRQVQYDAVFLATLDEYLSQHSELKTRIPNLILIFHPFTDNRFNGEGAKFVQMIQALEKFRSRITDANYSNVLFVYSHYCSVTSKQVLRNPSERLGKFKEVIEEYTQFPKPIMTSVIENQVKENELPMVNGNYELPNKEYFPLNLLDKFDRILLKGKDEMGRKIINKALRHSHSRQDHLNVSKSMFEMVSQNHPKVARYLNILSSSIVKFRNTEISVLLENAFNSTPPHLKAQFPKSLEYLQKYMKMRNIRSKTDLPKTTGAILELLENVEKNEAVLYLLEQGLNLRTPVFPSSVVAGYSFNLLKYTVLPISPFKINASRISEIGFRIPDSIKCRKESQSFNLLKIFDNMEQYVRYKLATSGGISVGLVEKINIFTGLNGQVKPGYFVNDTSCFTSNNNSSCTFVATRNFKLFQFELDESAPLNPHFIQRVTNLSPLNESNYESVQYWNDFFNDYGTHIVKSAWGGGRVAIKFNFPSAMSVENVKNKVFKTVEFAENLTMLISGEKIDPKQMIPGGVNHSLVFYGGSHLYHISDLTALNLEEANKLIKNWKMSLKLNPKVYPTEYVPIYKIAQSVRLEKSEYIKEATFRLLNSNLTFKPPPNPTPDAKVLEDMARQLREHERKLEVERRHVERERRRLAMEQERERKRAEFIKAAEELMHRISLYRIEIQGEKDRARMCRESEFSC